MVKEDIKLAQRIILNNYNPVKATFFHSTSFIYKTTNERVCDCEKYFAGKKTVFSITASGDQIFHHVLNGSTHIDICDISRFPNYFFELKKAAILSLSKPEYLKFFYTAESYYEEFDEYVYEKIRENLDEKSKEFWDGLFCFFDGNEIYESMLFSHEPLYLNSILDKNSYLTDENYEKLKTLLPKVEFKSMVNDIYTIIPQLTKSYDLVYFSNIFNYDQSPNKTCYKTLLNQFPLTENGSILTYLYQVNNSIQEVFSEPCYFFDTFENRSNGVMIYQRTR